MWPNIITRMLAFSRRAKCLGSDAVGYKGRLLVEYHLSQSVAHTAGQKPGVCERAVEFWDDVRAEMDMVNAETRSRHAFDRLLCSISHITLRMMTVCTTARR